MQDNDPQSTDINDYVTPAKPHGEKVIQPSAAFIVEMKSGTDTAPIAPQLPPTDATPLPTNVPPPSSTNAEGN